MDISKEYVLMCEKAGKIQNEWGVCDGDFFYNKDTRITGTALVPFGTDIWNKRYKIWLPRQDQLQEMIIGKTTYADLEEQFNNTLNTWFEISYNFDPKIDEKLDMAHWSMEQLWLAFVMVEKYNKIWNGKDWIKKNT